jgi:protocatechuate 3,4-dioxygenase beta subunit
MITRRTLLLSVPLLVSARTVHAATAPLPAAYSGSKYIAPDDAPSEIEIASAKEPGERLIVAGKVTSIGRVALVGVSLYVFQADAAGRYATKGNDVDTNASLWGALRTDKAGQFAYSTVRPGQHGGNPATIRYVVRANNFTPHLRELWFWDDPIIEERVAKNQPEIPKNYPPGSVTIVPAIRNVQRILRSTHNIVLEHT